MALHLPIDLFSLNPSRLMEACKYLPSETGDHCTYASEFKTMMIMTII